MIVAPSSAESSETVGVERSSRLVPRMMIDKATHTARGPLFAWCKDSLKDARVKVLKRGARSRGLIGRPAHPLVTALFYWEVVQT